MDFKPAIRRLGDRRRFQDARPHDIPVPRDAQAMREFLVQPEPDGAGRRSHELVVVLLLMKLSTGTSDCSGSRQDKYMLSRSIDSMFQNRLFKLISCRQAAASS